MGALKYIIARKWFKEIAEYRCVMFSDINKFVKYSIVDATACTAALQSRCRFVRRLHCCAPNQGLSQLHMSVQSALFVIYTLVWHFCDNREYKNVARQFQARS